MTPTTSKVARPRRPKLVVAQGAGTRAPISPLSRRRTRETLSPPNNPTPTLNYERSQNLKPIIHNVKKTLRDGGYLSSYTSAAGDPVFLSARKQRSAAELEESKRRWEELQHVKELNWLNRRGVGEDKQRRTNHEQYMKAWFSFLDEDESGDIGVDELEDPLISLGLAHSRKDAEELVEQYDEDGDMELSYQEFRLLLMGKERKAKRVALKDQVTRKKIAWKNQSNPKKTTESRIESMFDDISSGKVGTHGLPLDMSISAYRRKLLMDANMSPRDEDKRKGLLVLRGILSSRIDDAPKEASETDEHQAPPTPKSVTAAQLSAAIRPKPEVSRAAQATVAPPMVTARRSMFRLLARRVSQETRPPGVQ